jgi:hypothetical protein
MLWPTLAPYHIHGVLQENGNKALLLKIPAAKEVRIEVRLAAMAEYAGRQKQDRFDQCKHGIKADADQLQG